MALQRPAGPGGAGMRHRRVGPRGRGHAGGPVTAAAPPVDADAVQRGRQLLGKAGRPLIVAGGGALDAGPEVLAVAEALQAPVVPSAAAAA